MGLPSCVSVYLSVCPSVCLSVCLTVQVPHWATDGDFFLTALDTHVPLMELHYDSIIIVLLIESNRANRIESDRIESNRIEDTGCVSVYLSVCLFVCLSVLLYKCHIGPPMAIFSRQLWTPPFLLWNCIIIILLLYY